MYPLQKIINVASELNQTGTTAASTGEKIAAAFVLNRMDYLPDGYSDIIEAWDFLGVQWQGYVRIVKRNYSRQINNQ
jgi:hypothetical protein